MKIRTTLTLASLVGLLLIGARLGLAQASQAGGRLAPGSVASTNGAAGAAWESGAYIEQVVAPSHDNFGAYVSLAFRSSGAPVISYYDAIQGDLRVAWPNSSNGNCGPENQWYCQTVDSVGDVGKYSAIAVAPRPIGSVFDIIGVAYADATTGAVKYAEWTCTDPITCFWTIKTVTTFKDNRGIALKFDAWRKPHIAFAWKLPEPADLTGLNYAHYVGTGGNCTGSSGWQCEAVDMNSRENNVFEYPSLALDANDEPRIAYSASDAAPPYLPSHTLYFAEHHPNPSPFPSGCNPASDYWSCKSLISFSAAAPKIPSLAISVQNGTEIDHIAVYDPILGTLEYARSNKQSGIGAACNAEDTWQCETIDAMPLSAGWPEPYGMPVSLAIDAGGWPIIVYQGENSYGASMDLKIARLAFSDPSFWGLGNCGDEGMLGHGWYCVTLEAGIFPYNEAEYVSVAVNPSGLAAIAYHETDEDHNLGSLKYAYQLFKVYLPLTTK